MKTEEILDRLPFLIAARLDSDPELDDVPVIVSVKGNLIRMIQQAQAFLIETEGKHGACIVVLQIQANDIYEGLPGGPMLLRPAIWVIEDVEMNNGEHGTKKSTRWISRHIIKTFKVIGQFEGVVQAMKVGSPGIEPVVWKDMPESLVCEQVNLECQEASPEPISYTLVPVLTAVPNTNPPQITMASATPGAQVWYTTDDSYPFPWAAGEEAFPSTSTLYTGPVTVAIGTIISAVAYRDGSVASSLIRKIIAPLTPQ